MADAEYPFLSVVELGRLYRTGQVSPVEVTGAILERIEDRQADTSAYITVTRDRAMADARAAGRSVRPKGRLPGRLPRFPTA